MATLQPCLHCERSQHRRFQLALPGNKNVLSRLLFLFFTVVSSLRADPTMPHQFSDGMVFQREAAFRIWGSADPDDSLTVTFGRHTSKTIADNAGHWKISLLPMRGKFTLK
jgi:sialate O-acetylesterase